MEMYAKRLNNPFQGVLQVVASERVRALSFDGIQWELQFQCDVHRMKPAFADTLPRFQYARIGRWEARHGFKPYPLDPAMDRAEVESHYPAVVDALGKVRIPLPQDDHYECWLLDDRDKQPLALLASCRQVTEMAAMTVARPCWHPPNAGQLPIDCTEEENRRGLPPVNYRLENLVKQRAGQNPVAQWFLRQPDGQGSAVSADGQLSTALPARQFPELLLREDWESPAEQALCERYLQRLAPQLLVLQGLSLSGRERVERMASQQVIEMDSHFHLYPAVADPQRMTAWRVEARLRKALVKDEYS